MGQYTNKGIKDIVINFLLFIVLVLLLAVPAYFCYKIFIVDTKDVEEQSQEEVTPTEQQVEDEEELVLEQTDPYEEFFPILEDQQAYVMVPGKIDNDRPPVLIIYSHGSNTTVTQNMEDPFMQDLFKYGEFFTKENYIFAASNQHGVNWGNQASIRDTYNVKEWVMQNYDIEPNVYLIGFSMGGLPTMNFASQYSEEIDKIALLAPTTRSSEWNATRVEKIKNIDIKIWHGNADVNVPYSLSTKFVSTLKNLGKEVTLITLEGKTHWDVDTEYMEDILLFFNE